MFGRGCYPNLAVPSISAGAYGLIRFSLQVGIASNYHYVRIPRLMLTCSSLVALPSNISRRPGEYAHLSSPIRGSCGWLRNVNVPAISVLAWGIQGHFPSQKVQDCDWLSSRVACGVLGDDFHLLVWAHVGGLPPRRLDVITEAPRFRQKENGR